MSVKKKILTRIMQLARTHKLKFYDSRIRQQFSKGLDVAQ